MNPVGGLARIRYMLARASAALAILAIQLGAQVPTAPATGIVTGIVKNRVTGDPVRVAVVRLSGGSISTLSNDAGRYRIELPLGEHRLDGRRIGYRPSSVAVTVTAVGTTQDIELDPIPVGLERVLVTEKDDFARRLVSAAIARKQRLRGTLHDYHNHGEVRLLVRNLDKPVDSASSVLFITESQTEAYWEQPNLFQETIVARRQTGNIDAERNLIGAGQILNVGRERVLFARFELPSPIADDALELYDYRVLDTLVVEARRTYRLSVEPKANGLPAFVGVMDIVDSTFDVVGMDVGVNREVRVPRALDIRYQQRFRELDGGRWMPYSVELTYTIDIAPFGRFGVRHMASLSNFRFNDGKRPAGLGEYRIVVSPRADVPDSAMWAGLRVAPLTPADSAGWKRIDSIASTPGARAARIVNNTLRSSLIGGSDFFHFNRVDGAYVGAGHTWYSPPSMPGTEPTLKLGYTTGSHLWQLRAGDRVRLSEDRRIWIGAIYHDETVPRPTLTSAGYEATRRALVSTADPLDYYRDRGLSLSTTAKLMRFTDAELGYTDARQSSLTTVITRPPLHLGPVDEPFRPNHVIDDGHLRALTGGLSFDTRPLAKQGGRDLRFNVTRFTRLNLTGEWAPDGAISSDFSYRRATVRFERRQTTKRMGWTTFLATGGVGTSALPLQRAFTVDGGARVLAGQPSPFNTLGDSSFVGTRSAVVAIQHDFDRLLFTMTRLPLVRDIPFTLSVSAGAFWSALPVAGLDSGFVARRQGFNVTRDPYREVGFTVGNLTPFLPLFNFSARFAWQLSDYPTTPFRFSIGLSR